MKTQKALFGFLLVLTCCSWLGQGCSQVEAGEEMQAFDEAIQQVPVTRHGQLDSVLAQLPIVPFAKLDTAYLRYAGIEGNWKGKLKKKTWHSVAEDQLLLYVVGTFRVRDFMPHWQTLFNPSVELDARDRHYFCMDHKVLHKLLDLLTWMQDNNLDTDELIVNYGFRHPTLNFNAGGVAHSCHQLGEAIDLAVGDVNRDGKTDDADKAPLLKILDTKIIANGGGVGRYPNTPIIHMDVRGHRARWDHQGPSAAMKAQMAAQGKSKKPARK